MIAPFVSLILLAAPVLSQTCAVAQITTSSVPKLPDPFKLINGSRVATKADWDCRREEINQLHQRYELGALPDPPESVTATLSGSSLSITVSDKGKSISFSVSISAASGGTAPYPAIIAYGGMSIPKPSGVAVITFNNDDMAAQQDKSSRGKGKFFNLYGSNHTAGALMAWAWGVGRIIDAIEKTPSTNIDPKRLGVTGCSRNGKGAIVAGAFNPRIALTIPQESGSGGAACWRLSDAQLAGGTNVQTATEIIDENVWFSKLFEPYVKVIPTLPVDHHELAGLVAPRGLYVIENTSMEWLGAESTNGCMRAGQLIYQALGVPSNMGYSQVGGHNHCAFPSSQNAELQAFVDKFFFSKSTNTSILKTDGKFNFNTTQWIDWTVPTLS